MTYRSSTILPAARNLQRRMVWVVAALVLSADWPLQAATPVLRVVSSQTTATNLIRNGGFETRQGGALTFWQAAPQGYRIASGEGRNGSQALACAAPDTTGWRGASQTLTLNRTNALPLVVSGWSRAEGVTGGRDSGYSLYVDLVYADGSPLWGQTANFATGTHDWERRELVIVPDKPVRSLTVHCLLRGKAGQVWFDDVSVTETGSDSSTILFQGTPMEPVEPPPPLGGEPREYSTGDDLRLVMRGQRLASLRVGESDLTANAPGGFLARDVAAESDLFTFAEGTCPELGLALDSQIHAAADHLAIEGTLTDTRGSDRAVLLLFALPVDARGWIWGDDIRSHRTIEGNTEFTRVNPVGCGTTGRMSAYPLAAIHDHQSGLALALDMGRPAQFRLVYHAGTRQFFIAWDFGLVPETERLPGGARFCFVLFRFDPEGGFRAAWQRYQKIFPDHFAVRSREQGIWMPFTDVSTVEGWQDFGFRYHEGDNNVAWDDAHGVLSFRYTEPMTWWMPMAPELPRTEAEALRVREQYATGPSGRQRQMALATQAAAMFEPDGRPALLFRNEPWANGAVWSLNPNPHLPASPNGATVHWDDAIKDQLYGPTAKARLDGEYLDSLEGYVTADLNFRREHFRYSTVPLTFATESRQPALFKGLAVYEFTRWISEDVHRLGGLMFANSVPYRFSFLVPWLDVMGTETDWLSGGTYRAVSDSQACLWRTLAGGKPYLLLMNTDYNRFTPELVERYFQRCLFYGFFPSMFSHNAAENPYWQNPAWYNRDRPLFKRYIPLVRQVAEAGWQPVTGAACENPQIFIERFGPTTNGVTYLTLLNDTAKPQSGLVRLVGRDAGVPDQPVVTELLSGSRVAPSDGAWPVSLAPGATAVLRFEAGPRFIGVETGPNRVLHLTIETPAGLAQVLELSTNLRDWLTLETNSPGQSPYSLTLGQREDSGAHFFRLRW